MTETIGAGGSGAYPTKEHALQAAADRIGKKEAHAMTDFVTVRRDALRALVEVSVAYHSIPLVAPITEVYTRAVDDRLAAMSVSPWREIDDEARNGEPWLVATKMEPPGKWRRQIARYIPRYTEQSDEDFAERCEENDEYYTPEGWYEMCYEHDEYIAMGMKEAPSLYAPIPELPK